MRKGKWSKRKNYIPQLLFQMRVATEMQDRKLGLDLQVKYFIIRIGSKSIKDALHRTENYSYHLVITFKGICEESWAPTNWCFWTVVLEKTLESPLDCKEIQLVHPKRDQSWVFIGRTDAKVETPILWPPHAKSWLFGKDPVAGRDWGPEEKGKTEDEMAGWHHWLDGREFE